MDKIKFVFKDNDINKIIGIKVNDKLYNCEAINILEKEKIYKFLEEVSKKEPDFKKILKEQRKIIEEKQQKLEQEELENDENNMDTEIPENFSQNKDPWYAKLEEIRKQEEKINASLPVEIIYENDDQSKPTQFIIKNGKEKINYVKQPNKSYYEFAKFVADIYPNAKKQLNWQKVKKDNTPTSKIINLNITKRGKAWLKEHKKSIARTGIAIGGIITLGHMVALIPKLDLGYDDVDEKQYYEANQDDNKNKYFKVSGEYQNGNSEKDFEISYDESIFDKNKTVVIGDGAPEIIIENNNDYKEENSYVETPKKEETIIETPNEENSYVETPKEEESYVETPKVEETIPETPDKEESIPQITTPEEEYKDIQESENMSDDVYNDVANSLRIYYTQTLQMPSRESVINSSVNKYGNEYIDSIEQAYDDVSAQYEFNAIQVGSTSR